ncbi:hypothetical protein L0244_06965 [bacterium]|nr:hypothetical protein [bacterium]
MKIFWRSRDFWRDFWCAIAATLTLWYLLYYQTQPTHLLTPEERKEFRNEKGLLVPGRNDHGELFTESTN